MKRDYILKDGLVSQLIWFCLGVFLKTLNGVCIWIVWWLEPKANWYSFVLINYYPVPDLDNQTCSMPDQKWPGWDKVLKCHTESSLNKGDCLGMKPWESLPLAGSIWLQRHGSCKAFKNLFHGFKILGSYRVGVQTKKAASWSVYAKDHF